MSATATQGIVLREVSYKDADKILTVLTPNLGKLTVTAKNSRKKGGGISAASQLLVWSDMTLSSYNNRYSLKEAETIMDFRNMRSDIQKISLGSYFAEVVDKIVEENAMVPDILQLLLNSLYAIDKLNKPLKLIKAAFELRLMVLLGYAPNLKSCYVCNNINIDNPQFDLTEGVIYCQKCAVLPKKNIKSLSQSVLSVMRYITVCDSKKLFSFRLDDSNLNLLGNITEQFLLTHLDRRFYTLDFYKKL